MSEQTPLHYQSSITKIDADGNEVLSSYLEPGERLKGGASYAELVGGKDTLPAEQIAGGAAFTEESDQASAGPAHEGDALTTDETVTHTRGRRAAAKKDDED